MGVSAPTLVGIDGYATLTAGLASLGAGTAPTGVHIVRYPFRSPARVLAYRSPTRAVAYQTGARTVAFRSSARTYMFVVAAEGLAMPAVPIGTTTATPLLETQEQGNVYSIDFSPRLATNETVVSATAQVLNTSGQDVSATLIQGVPLVLPNPTSTVTPAPNTAAGVALHNPTVNATYTLRLVVTTSAGRSLQDRIVGIQCDD